MRQLSDEIKWHGQWLNLSKKKMTTRTNKTHDYSLSHDPTLTGKHIHIICTSCTVRKWTGSKYIYGHDFHTPFLTCTSMKSEENCTTETCTSTAGLHVVHFVCFFLSIHLSLFLLLLLTRSVFTPPFCLHHMLPHFQNRDSLLQAATPLTSCHLVPTKT